MEKYEAVFARVEKKYIVTSSQASFIVKELLKHMTPDTRGIYTIMSLYLDSDDDLLIRESLEKPEYKEKIRLRSYGVPDENSDVYLELKKKSKGIVYKRRIAMNYAAAMAYINTGAYFGEKSQIQQELDWTLQRYRAKPKGIVCYDRLAFFGKGGESALRITFDMNARCRDADLDMSMGDYGTPLLSSDQCIMEIKTAGGMPMWLCSLLNDSGIFPASFSKYGNFYMMRHKKQSSDGQTMGTDTIKGGYAKCSKAS